MQVFFYKAALIGAVIKETSSLTRATPELCYEKSLLTDICKKFCMNTFWLQKYNLVEMARSDESTKV
jgi:hypothetical protein